jgi:predicted GH43/DUF377 family glycosyl hydrolase
MKKRWQLRTALAASLLVVACVGPLEVRAPLCSADNLATVAFQRIAGAQPLKSVLAPEPNTWRSGFLGMPTVVQADGRYLMYFTAEEKPERGESPYVKYLNSSRIGLATSTDGTFWEINPQPVVMPTITETSDRAGAAHPFVIYRNGRFTMWYGMIDGTQAKNGVRREVIGIATSTDGVSFRKMGPVSGLGDLQGLDDVQATGMHVEMIGGRYVMWYGGYGLDREHTILSATSDDGITWRRLNAGKPLVGLAPDGVQVLGPSVYFDGLRYLMFYSRNDGNVWRLHKATSNDGINWRWRGEVLPAALPKWFDDADIGQNHSVHPSQILLEGSRVRIWYTGESRTENGLQSIGLMQGTCRE